MSTWSQMVPSPHPHPRRQQKSPARGQKELETHTCLITFYDLYERSRKSTLPGGLNKKGSARKLHPPFSRGSPERGNPTMTTSTITAKRKGNPQHYVEEKIPSSGLLPRGPSGILSAFKAHLLILRLTLRESFVS